MRLQSLLVANRGEIALRVIRAARELGVRSVAIYSIDDADAAHVARADTALALGGVGPRAYLDQTQIIELARSHAQAIHPGYGFLSENAAFARAAAHAGLIFVGPSAETLDLFGDKAKARAFAEAQGVPIPAGENNNCTPENARALLAKIGANGKIAVKALSGGGGRGIRFVGAADDIEGVFERCRAEARLSFGDDRLYIEEMILDARHVEVQAVGDGERAIHLGERDCTLQRRNQKLVEIAPAPDLSDAMRRKLHDAAITLATAARLRGVATFEFLLSGAGSRAARFVFIEANPRIQVEHTITEEITGVDLVRTQIEIAGGAMLADLGLLNRTPSMRGSAMQVRVNAEIVGADGDIQSSGGRISALHLPGGPGVRIDSAARVGAKCNPAFDTLLAKLVVRDNDYTRALARARQALAELQVEGVGTNLGFLRALLNCAPMAAYQVNTSFVEDHWAMLAAAAALHDEANALVGSPPLDDGASIDLTTPPVWLTSQRPCREPS
ncbi:MAG: methylcrotonoyl-CoA carboxylase [Hyphomonadaceae bacterium JAD_PAG50586_4]|nr:MAG: methylcrotonoyl-CoA carboxylase [Hyphomonadaceae bacterium JAD_PAG50586_4]